MSTRSAARPASCPCRCSCLLLVLATTPLWIARVGLYQYLALEIMIWMMFALGYNLLLGTTGLPSFGHGAFFGVGAYAFGLLQQRVVAEPLVRPAAARSLVAALLGARGGGLHLAPARHLLRAADHRLRPGVLVRRDQVAQRHRRRGRPAQHQAPAAADSASRPSTCAPTRRCFYFALALFALVLVVLWRLVHSPFGRVLRGDQAERDCAPRSSATTSGSTSGCAFTHLGGGRRPGRRAVRDGAAVGLSQRDEPAPVGLRRDDGADRRRPGELLGAGDRRRCSSSSRATCSAPTPRPGCSGTACCSWRWCCSSPRASPASGRRGAGAWRRRPRHGVGPPARVPLREEAPWRSSKPPACTSASATASCCRTSRSPSRKASCPASWARTAPARPPASTCSPAATSPTAAASRFAGEDITGLVAAARSRARASRARSR